MSALFQIAYWVIAETVFRKDKDMGKAGDVPDPNVLIGLFSLLLIPSIARILAVAGFWDLPILELYSPISIFLVILQNLGMYFRFTAMKTLGDFFTPGLRTKESQKVLDVGPYAIVRHPGYLGNFLTLIPCGLAVSPHPVVLVVCVAIFYFAWSNRIALEENMMLTSALGEQYKAYQKRVPYKILPYVF